MPTPFDTTALKTIPLTPRYAVDDNRGEAKKKKIRQVDDFRAGGINDIVVTHDADIPGNLDTLLAIANSYKNWGR